MKPCDREVKGTNTKAEGIPLAYRWYVLILLTAVYAVHVMDRTIINLILEPIKQEFHLDNSALGLLTGLGYAVPFAVAGLPLGALADRRSRKRVLAAIMTVWSVFTAAGGITRGFGSLLAARMAVGAAESGSPPTALALMSDYFPSRVRASAVSIFYAGASIGTILAAQIGGRIAAEYGWRAALFAAAAPGLILAFVIALTVREPVGGAMESNMPTAADRTESAPPFREVFKMIIREKGIIFVLAALVFAAMSTVGISTWVPSLLMSEYGMSLGQAGSLISLSGIVGLGGTLLGGALAYVYARERTARLLILSGAANVLQVPVLLIGLSASGVAGFRLLFLVWTVLQTVYYGAGFGLVLNLAPSRMRGRLMAITFVLSNVLGAGFGPQIVGFLSDTLAGAGDTKALAHAVGALVLAAGLAGILFLAALRSVPTGLDRALGEKMEAARPPEVA
jgi:predicted MFS family arabinose efflux permease